MPPRISLTPAQVQAGIGAELLALCQTLTADGILTDPEVAELRKWLEDNSRSDLPAIGFLTATLEHILEDGKVTLEERAELYTAIEKVLPVEARRVATDNRKAVQAAMKELAKEKRQEQRAAAKEEREAAKAERARDRAVYAVNFMVAGVHYEGRHEVIRKHVQEGDRVFLARDPKNKFSRNAIEVRTERGFCYGYVPEDFAPEVAPLLDQGLPHVAYVRKLLCGGRVPIPVVQAYLHNADAEVENLTFTSQVPAKCRFHFPGESRATNEAGSRSRVWTAAIVLLFVLLLVVKCRS